MLVYMNDTSSSLHLLKYICLLYVRNLSSLYHIIFPSTFSIAFLEISGLLEDDAFDVHACQLGAGVVSQAVDEPPDRGEEQASH